MASTARPELGKHGFSRTRTLKSNATNPVGQAVETLLARSVHRILDQEATDLQKQKVLLAMRGDTMSPEMEMAVLQACQILQDTTEEVACELINTVLISAND